MAKKNKRGKKSRPSDIASLDASAKKLQSLLVQPDLWAYQRSGAIHGLRSKILKIDMRTVRNVVDRVPLISAIINLRVDQVKKFAKYTTEKGDTGYEFYLADPTKEVKEEDQKLFYQLSDFIDQTGLLYDSTREDDFNDYLDMFVRETLTIDQVATEIQRNRKQETIAFWLLDASTIQRVDPDKIEKQKLVDINGQRVVVKKNDRFAQVVEDRVTNTYTDEDIIFDYKNKRADLRYRGFGYSVVEQCIDMITTLLFGYNYLRDQLIRDRVPKGFVQVMGDVGKDQLDAIRDYWYAAMTGAGGVWNIPVLPSGKDGIGLDWKNIQPSNRDMEYHKLMLFVTTIICAVFGVDPAELGIKTDDSTALIGENSEPRINASKDRGLGSLLSFIEQHINKVLRKVNDEVKFRFVGIERDDEQKLATLRKTNVETYVTINELREADGLDPLDDEYANIVLNPQAEQLYSASKMQEQGMGGDGDAFGFEDEDGDPGEDGKKAEGVGEGVEEDAVEVDWESMFKSFQEGKDLRVLIK